MLVARRLVVKGRVQGVGFRMFVQDVANAEGLHGWVANRPDEAVEVLAEGDREAVDRLERRVRSGPPGARVASVERSDQPPSGRATGFVVERWPVTMR